MEEHAKGWAALFAPATRHVAIVISVGIVLHSANIYLAAAVMPSVAADVGGLSLYAWATTVFVFAAVLGSTATATVLGCLGTRGAFRLAAVGVGAGTLVCALAPTMPVLLVGRFVQGLGGGLLFALAYSLVRLALDRALWARAMAVMSAMWGVGVFSGPALGGTFAELDAWRLAFWVVVPITLLAAWGAGRLPRDAGRQDAPAPPLLAGVGLLGAAVLVLSAASTSTRPAVNGLGIAGAAVLLAVWLRHERRTSRRLLPSATFATDGRLRWLYVAMALLMISATPEFFVPYFAQALQDLGPLAAGYLATAMSAGWTTAVMLLSGVERRRRLIVHLAPIVSAVGLGLLIGVGPTHGGGAPAIVGIGLGLALLGWGIGTAWPHLATAVLGSVSVADQDLAGSSITTVQLTAAAAGAAAAGAVVNLAGFADPGGAVGAHDAARWLYIATIAAPLLALVALWRHARREAAAVRGEVAPAPVAAS